MRKIILICLWGLLTNCGSDLIQGQEQYLRISMVGVFISPPDAIGTQEPIHQVFSIRDLQVTDADSGEVIDLYDSDSTSFRIISRPQIVHEVEITDLKGRTFSNLSLIVDDSVLAMTRSGDEVEVSLPSGSLSHQEAFTFSEGKSVELTVEVQWKDTVFKEAQGSYVVTPPTFSMGFDSD